MSKAWMPMYWGDYLSNTAMLSNEEHGIYIKLIAVQWQTGKPIATYADAYAIASATKKVERQKVDKILQLFYQKTVNGFSQKRVAEELAKCEEKADKARESASRRWTKADANAMRTHSERNANHNHNQNHNKKPPIPPKGGGVCGDVFSKKSDEAVQGVTGVAQPLPEQQSDQLGNSGKSVIKPQRFSGKADLSPSNIGSELSDFAKEGFAYAELQVSQLNNPVKPKFHWVSGWLTTFQPSETAHAGVGQAMLQLWRETVDLGLSSDVPKMPPNWYQTVFKRKVDEWKPRPQATSGGQNSVSAGKSRIDRLRNADTVWVQHLGLTWHGCDLEHLPANVSEKRFEDQLRHKPTGQVVEARMVVIQKNAS